MAISELGWLDVDFVVDLALASTPLISEGLIGYYQCISDFADFTYSLLRALLAESFRQLSRCGAKSFSAVDSSVS